jgi:hypothetical protein
VWVPFFVMAKYCRMSSITDGTSWEKRCRPRNENRVYHTPRRLQNIGSFHPVLSIIIIEVLARTGR